MLVEKLPIKREWEFFDNDDVVITFSMKSLGVAIPLVGCSAFSQIRESCDEDGVLVSEGECTIVDNVISAAFSRASLENRVGQLLYGDLRLLTADGKRVTLLSFTALKQGTVSRPVGN